MARCLGDDEGRGSESDEELLDEEDVVAPSPNIIVETAFDAYLRHSSTRSRTSANVFSSLVPPLTAEEYAQGIETAAQGDELEPSILAGTSRDMVFVRFMRELAEGFNLLMYGYGSKRRVLNEFATEYCAKAGDVVVANGFQPEFTFKDLLCAMERIAGIADAQVPCSTPETRARRVYDFFAVARRPVFVIVHNIDAAPLRAGKAKSCLALLALSPHIRLVASIDHINAPLLFSTSESAARKPDPRAPPPAVPPRGFAWLWHDLTTLAPYDFELAFADRTSIAGAHAGGPRTKTHALAVHGPAPTALTETAALHVLASVTQKAKKLFVLIGARQLQSIEGTDVADSDLQHLAIAYDMLFNIARNDFIATNDTAMRSLLGEFRDHSLVVSAQGPSGSGEVLWIPLRKERLAAVLKSLQQNT